MPIPRRALPALAAAALPAIPARAAAQSWPTRPVRLIVTFPPGGPADVIGRILAERLGEAWGQPVIIEIRGGAGGNIGAEAAARAAPDGHTLVVVASSHVQGAALYRRLPFDPIADFTPITQVAYYGLVVVLHPSVPAQNLAEFEALLRARPGEITITSAGVGTPTHLGVEVFARQAGIKLVHVPYRGVAEAMNDLLSGQISMIFSDLPAAIPLVQDGKIRALGVLTKERHPLVPEIPTVAETLPGFWLMGWQGLLAPGGTPDEIIDKLNAPLVAYLKTPAAAERLRKIGVDVAWTTPREMRDWIESQLAWWGKVARDAGVTPQ